MRTAIDARRGLAALAFAASTGCSSRDVEVREPLPAAPYAVSDGGRLAVRADLLSQLRFARASRTDLLAVLQGFGRVAFAPGASYAVRSAVPAYVERVLVNVGQEVARGTALAVLRAPEIARLRAEVRRVQVELDASHDEITRLARLVPEGAASERELVSARARASALRAELAGVQGSLRAASADDGSGEAFTLRASGAGTVIAREVDPGERVDPAGEAPAFLVGDPSSVVVMVSIPERDAPLLAQGSRCTFEVGALGAQRFEGEVTQVVHALDQRTHTTSAACRPRSVDPRLRAEMSARVEIDARGTEAVLVPRGAVLLRRDEHVVFVRRGAETLERRAVEVGAAFGDRVQVLRGVAPDEEVVTDNAVLLDGELDQLL